MKLEHGVLSPSSVLFPRQFGAAVHVAWLEEFRSGILSQIPAPLPACFSQLSIFARITQGIHRMRHRVKNNGFREKRASGWRKWALEWFVSDFHNCLSSSPNTVYLILPPIFILDMRSPRLREVKCFIPRSAHIGSKTLKSPLPLK